MVRPRVCKTDLVQMAIAADSLFDPLRALTVFRTLFTHLSNLDETRVLIIYGRGESFANSAICRTLLRNLSTSSSQTAMSLRS